MFAPNSPACWQARTVRSVPPMPWAKPGKLRMREHTAARSPEALAQGRRPRVLAVEDVRYGSVNRVASAVGEGATAVQLVH
jgi:thioredoxin reductase